LSVIGSTKVASKKKSAGLLLDEVLPQAQRTARSLLSLDPQEDVPASQQALEMALGFVPGIGQAMALRDIERARRANDPAAAAMAATEFVPFGRLAGMMRRPGPIMSEIDVYHGSPHRFEEFDASKIGTGEGAQAYGHGIYLAESPGVAKSYQTALTHSDDYVDGQLLDSSIPNHLLARVLSEESNNIDNARDSLTALTKPGGSKSVADSAKQALKLLDAGERPVLQTIKPKGSFYTADLPDEMADRMLDWDKPLSEQPEAVRQALLKLGDENSLMTAHPQKLWDFRGMIKDPNVTGQQIHSAYEDLFKSRNVAGRMMQKAGIPGIRYLDAGSRGQGGSGTRNFVVFPGEEKKVKIKKRE